DVCSSDLRWNLAKTPCRTRSSGPGSPRHSQRPASPKWRAGPRRDRSCASTSIMRSRHDDEPETLRRTPMNHYQMLREKVMKHGAINNPYLDRFQRGELNDEDLRDFAVQFYGF